MKHISSRRIHKQATADYFVEKSNRRLFETFNCLSVLIHQPFDCFWVIWISSGQSTPKARKPPVFARFSLLFGWIEGLLYSLDQINGLIGFEVEPIVTRVVNCDIFNDLSLYGVEFGLRLDLVFFDFFNRTVLVDLFSRKPRYENAVFVWKHTLVIR